MGHFSDQNITSRQWQSSTCIVKVCSNESARALVGVYQNGAVGLCVTNATADELIRVKQTFLQNSCLECIIYDSLKTNGSKQSVNN